MKIYKLFLASSEELREDRDKFEIFISRTNTRWAAKNIYLELVRWENFIDAMSKNGLQEEYNKAIASSDIFLMLLGTKLGKYTEEEFDRAFANFHVKDRPIVYTYFKDIEPTKEVLQEDLQSLQKFKNRLAGLKHYPTFYKNIDALLFQLEQQLTKLEEAGFFSAAPHQPSESPSPMPAVTGKNINTGTIQAGGNIIIGNGNKMR